MTITLGMGPNVVVDDCETLWAKAVGAGVTPELDGSDKKVGTYSMKFTITTDLGSGVIIATGDQYAKDLRQAKFITAWVKSSINIAAGALQLLLDNNSECVSPVETLLFPALTANTWKQCIFGLTSPKLCGAIISVGLKQTADLGACVLHLDQVTAILSNDYDVLSIKGFNSLEDVSFWPKDGAVQQDLDGAIHKYRQSFSRKITIDFGVVKEGTGTSQEYNRLFLLAWLMSPLMTITYAGETLAVEIPSDYDLSAEWKDAVSFAKAFVLEVVEKNPRTTIPTSIIY